MGRVLFVGRELTEFSAALLREGVMTLTIECWSCINLCEAISHFVLFEYTLARWPRAITSTSRKDCCQISKTLT